MWSTSYELLQLIFIVGWLLLFWVVYGHQELLPVFYFFVTSLKHFIHSVLQLCESQISWLSLTTNEIEHCWTFLYVNIILKFHVCKLLWQVHTEDGGSRFIWQLVKFLTSNIADLLYAVYKKCLQGMHNGVLSHAHFICRTVQFW